MCIRYKESISKGTRGLKEKILARNSSVKELSKGVQREMSAGIAGVARIIERLDLTPKRSGTSASVPGHVVETSNFSTREKCSLEDLLTQSFRDGTEIVHNISPDAELHDMGNIPGRLEVIPTQVTTPFFLRFDFILNFLAECICMSCLLSIKRAIYFLHMEA